MRNLFQAKGEKKKGVGDTERDYISADFLVRMGMMIKRNFRFLISRSSLKKKNFL